MAHDDTRLAGRDIPPLFDNAPRNLGRNPGQTVRSLLYLGLCLLLPWVVAGVVWSLF